MKTGILIVLTTLAFLGLSVSAFAGKLCEEGDARPKCNPGGGDDHGDPSAQYCAELMSGGFDIGRQTVTRNNRGNSYSSNSTEGLELKRGFNGADTVAWDAVFKTCPATYLDGSPATVNVSNDWSIDNSGGRSAGTENSRVNLSFRNSWIPMYPTVEIDLFLVGMLPHEFPSEFNDYQEIDIPIGMFWYYVHAHGNEDCKIQG